MSKKVNIDDIKSSFEEKKKEIIQEDSEHAEWLIEDIADLENSVVDGIIDEDISDEDKRELKKIFNDELAKLKIILSMSSNIDIDEIKNLMNVRKEKIMQNYKKAEYEVIGFENRVRTCIKDSNISDQDKLELAKLFDSVSVIRIIRSMSDDKLKLQFLNSTKCDEVDVEEIVSSMSSDNLKLEFIHNLKSDYSRARIASSMSSEKFKIEALKNIDISENRGMIIFDILQKKENENIELFLENVNESKKDLGKYLNKRLLAQLDRNLWDFMIKANMQNYVIPAILFSSKYEILNDKLLTDSMKKDIEDYLGETLPNNVENLSKYEKVGIDLEALQGEVITSEEQLQLDKFQEAYFNSVHGSPSDVIKKMNKKEM